jgi:hypothetical protein
MLRDLTNIEWEIINYLRIKPGSSKADIIRYLRDMQMASRMTTLQYIKDLETKNIVYGKKERPNSQVIMMYVNEKNQFLSVLTELGEFEAAYLKLLEKSKDRIINLKESDPLRWKEENRLKYKTMEKEKETQSDSRWRQRSKENIKKLSEQIEESCRELSILDNKLHTDLDSRQHKDIMLNIHRHLSNLESIILEIKPLVDSEIKSLYDVKNYEIDFLQFNPIIIYYWFVEIMVFRTIFVWPNDIKDKQILSNMYSIVFRTVSEIQTELLEFLSIDKMGLINKTPMEIIALIIRAVRDVRLYYMPEYQVLDMKSEINSVTNALLKINEEIKNYKFVDVSNMEMGYDLDKTLRLDKLLSEFLKQTEILKNKADITTSEYHHHNQIILQMVKGITQLST